MAKKVTAKIAPEPTGADKTSRSILVMDAPKPTPDESGAVKKAETAGTAPLVNRTAKTIQPPEVSTDTAEPVEPVPVDTEPAEEEPLEKPADTKPATITTADAPPATETPKAEPAEPAEDTPPAEATVEADQSDAARQVADDKEIAAQEARNQELEALIASGKYAVPINAVHKKRSRMVAGLALVLLVLAAVVTADLLADVGTITVPSSLPHTHFFAGN